MQQGAKSINTLVLEKNMNCITCVARQALEGVKHELTVMHGLMVVDAEAKDETFLIDTAATLQTVDDALAATEFSPESV